MITTGNTSRRPSLKLNALSNLIALVVSIGVGFLLTPVMLSRLGEKQFGIWQLVSSLVGYYGLLEVGVGAAVFRYVPLFHGQGNQHRVSAVVSTSMAFYTSLGIFIVLLTQLFANVIARFFEGGPELATLVRLTGLAAALNMPAIILQTSVLSYEGFVPSNLVKASIQVLRGTLLFACLLAGYGLVTMGWAVLLVSVVSLIGNSLVYRHTCKGAPLSLKAIRWAELKMLLAFGSVMLVVNTTNALVTESPKQVVAKTISLDALGLFSVPVLLIGYYRQLIISVTQVFSPRFSFLSGKAGEHEIARLFVRGCRYVTMVAGAVATLLWVSGPSFLLLWTRKPMIATVTPALAIMVVGTFVLLSHRMAGDLLFGLGRQKQIAILEMTEAAGILGLTIPLSLQYGVIGAAVGVAVPPLIVRGMLQTLFVCRILQFRFLEYYSKCVLKVWLVVAVVVAAAQLLEAGRLATGWPSLVLVSAAVLAVYLILIFTLVLDTGERTQLRLKAAAFLGRTKSKSLPVG